MNSLSTKHHSRAVVLRVLCGIGSAAVALAMAGCAGLPMPGPEEAVRDRAQARWDALVNGQVLKAYEYFSPGSRSVMSAEEYVTTVRRGFWKAAKVERVACQTQEACDVHLTIEYQYQGLRTKTPLRETWIRDGSQWWYVQR